MKPSRSFEQNARGLWIFMDNIPLAFVKKVSVGITAMKQWQKCSAKTFQTRLSRRPLRSPMFTSQYWCSIRRHSRPPESRFGRIYAPSPAIVCRHSLSIFLTMLPFQGRSGSSRHPKSCETTEAERNSDQCRRYSLLGSTWTLKAGMNFFIANIWHRV